MPLQLAFSCPVCMPQPCRHTLGMPTRFAAVCMFRQQAEGVINICVHLCLPVIIPIPVEHTPAFQSTDKIQYPVPANRIPITSACRRSLCYTSIPQYFPYVALPKQDLVPGGAQDRTDSALGKETYLMNGTIEACIVVVDTLSPMTIWVTGCSPVQHMLSLFHSSVIVLSLGPSQYGPGDPCV